VPRLLTRARDRALLVAVSTAGRDPESNHRPRAAGDASADSLTRWRWAELIACRWAANVEYFAFHEGRFDAPIDVETSAAVGAHSRSALLLGTNHALNSVPAKLRSLHAFPYSLRPRESLTQVSVV
jgi:hypothetical protein